MDKGTVARRRLSDAGLSSVQFVLAAGLSLILFTGLANLVVVQYGRGAIRSALEQGARAGSVAGAEACEATAIDVVDQLLGGSMSNGIRVRCVATGNSMSASATAEFRAWIPGVPDFEVAIAAESYLEPTR